ncbi:MAG: hypothetical protein H6718_23300 [Polyangiaceae bacterium]|nr:hypothetical protein [Myxococcales bacterium]MCB9588354.1 hypothetical protein [Polyangiaceae bacterium]
MRELFRDDYYAVTVDPDGIARITRLAKGYTTLIEAEASLDRLQLCIRRLPRSMAPKALVDLRESPGWNDEAFEKKTVAFRKELTARFNPLAILVRTVVGKLQISRLNRQDAIEAVVFDNEQQAMLFLKKPNS